MQPKMRVVASALTATMAAVWMTGCSNTTEANADYAEICQDPKTNKRLNDSDCQGSNGRSRGHWSYIPIAAGSRVIPKIGESVPGDATSVRPAGSTSTRVSSKGGSYAKSGTGHGGFGGKAGGGS
ncbi:MAG: hypothetical protein ACRDAX_08915 [Propionibacteriaceae bacterium]